MTTTNVLLIGSNFLSSIIFSKLYAFNDINITVLSRNDPLTIQNYNNDTYRIIRKHCSDLKYKDLYSGKFFGDERRKSYFSFQFKDWINESFRNNNADIIIHAGSIYDNHYAKANQKDTLNVNVQGMNNILSEVEHMAYQKRGIPPLFIFMSSLNVYGYQSNVQEEKIREDYTVPRPQTLLDYSLFAQEQMLLARAKDLDIDYMIFRLGTLIGDFTPRDSLVNAAVSALLLQKKEFELSHSNNSIELLDTRDLGNLINIVMHYYKEKKGKEYTQIVNQVYNIKCEEKEEKTVQVIIEAIYDAAVKLPTISKDHIKGIEDFKLKSPRITYDNNSLTNPPTVKFDKPISGEKALSLLKFSSMSPLVYSLLQHTVNYLLNYIITDMSDTQRKIFSKIFYLPSVPTPETVEKEDLKDEIKDLVKDVNAKIEEVF